MDNKLGIDPLENVLPFAVLGRDPIGDGTAPFIDLDTVDDSWDAMNAVSNALQETFTTMGTTMGESRGSSA